MLYSRPVKQFAGALMGLALCVSSTAAGATASISPMVALSAFGTAQSSSAVCATAGSSAAIAAAQAAPGTGCVLPVVDQPMPVAQPAPPAYIPPPVEGGGIGLLPLLGGLVLIAGFAALLLSNDGGDGDIDLPGMSPD